MPRDLRIRGEALESAAAVGRPAKEGWMRGITKIATCLLLLVAPWVSPIVLS